MVFAGERLVGIVLLDSGTSGRCTLVAEQRFRKLNTFVPHRVPRYVGGLKPSSRLSALYLDVPQHLSVLVSKPRSWVTYGLGVPSTPQ